MKYKINLVCEVDAINEKQAKNLAQTLMIIEKSKVNVVNPITIFNELKDVRQKSKEYFVSIILNTQNEIIETDIVSIGTLNTSIIHPREVFRRAIQLNGNAIIIAHNHPSGSLEPSIEDLNVTKRLSEAGKLLGITILDHLILTQNAYMSFAEKHLLN